LLGEAGLLQDGDPATTHFLALERFAAAFPKTRVVYDQHWVEVTNAPSSDNSRKPGYALFTSAGISAGIDMSLKVVEHLYGLAVAEGVARWMEYPYPTSNQRRIEL